MEFDNNKRSTRQSRTVSPFSRTGLQVPQLDQMAVTVPTGKEEIRSQGRYEKDLEERIDKFYTLLGKIKSMRGLWRHNSENKCVKPVIEPIWQPAFTLEDFVGVEGEVREMGEKVKGKKRGEVERAEKDEEENESGRMSQKDHQKMSEEMTWIEVEDSGINLNLSL